MAAICNRASSAWSTTRWTPIISLPAIKTVKSIFGTCGSSSSLHKHLKRISRAHWVLIGTRIRAIFCWAVGRITPSRCGIWKVKIMEWSLCMKSRLKTPSRRQSGTSTTIKWSLRYRRIRRKILWVFGIWKSHTFNNTSWKVSLVLATRISSGSMAATLFCVLKIAPWSCLICRVTLDWICIQRKTFKASSSHTLASNRTSLTWA